MYLQSMFFTDEDLIIKIDELHIVLNRGKTLVYYNSVIIGKGSDLIGVFSGDIGLNNEVGNFSS